MLEVDDISYHVRDKRIVQHVSFTAQPGRLTAIIGPNGAGKSTLLKVLSRQYQPAGGKVIWNGNDLRGYSDQQMALERAVLTQQTFMSITFPVEEVVLMGRYAHFENNPQKKDREAVQAAMEQCGIDHLAKRTYDSLSGGEQQRVQIARAMAQVNTSGRPTFMLLDEPLNNLDIRHQHTCLDLVRNYVSQGNVALVVMHDINLAALYADEVLLMQDGHTVAHGTPAAVLTEQYLSKAYQFPVRVETHPYHPCPAVYFGCPAKQPEEHLQNTQLHILK